MRRLYTAALSAVVLAAVSAQSPAPAPSASPSPSPASGIAPGTKLVVTTACGPVAALRSAPIVDSQTIVRDSAGNRVLLAPATEVEAKAGGETATAFYFVEAPTRDGPRTGYVGRACLKAQT